MELKKTSKIIFKLLGEWDNMRKIKFVNKKHTLGELKELLSKGEKYGYQVIRYYDKQNSYERDCFFKYPDKYLDLPVINYLVRENLVTILVYGGNKIG